MLKKYLSIILSFIIIFSLTACNKDNAVGTAVNIGTDHKIYKEEGSKEYKADDGTVVMTLKYAYPKLENEKDNKNIAKLICEIYDKYIDYCNNINKENK